MARKTTPNTMIAALPIGGIASNSTTNPESIITLSINTTLAELISVTKVTLNSGSHPRLVAALPSSIHEVDLIDPSKEAIDALPETVRKIKLDIKLPYDYIENVKNRMDEIEVMGQRPFFIKRKTIEFQPPLEYTNQISTLGLKRNSIFSTDSYDRNAEENQTKVARSGSGL